MSDLYEAAQALGRHLIVEHGYGPLEKILAGTDSVAQTLDGAVAIFEGPNLRVHAWVLDEDSPQPSLQAEGLRMGLTALEEAVPGRIKATVWVLAQTSARADALEVSFLNFEDGHFLSKTLVGRGVLCVESRRGKSVGRLAPSPAAQTLVTFLDPLTAPDEAASLRRLALRQAEERQVRRLLKGAATPMTWAIIIATTLVYALQVGLAQQLRKQGLEAAPADDVSMRLLGANDPALTLGLHQVWRLLAACFLHAGAPHLILNMMSLFSLGAITERLAGPWRLLTLYLLAGLGGSVLSALLGRNGVASLGASGAILGLAGALLATHWRRDPRLPKELSDRLFSWLARPMSLLFILGFALQWMDLPFQLDNFAHLGGLLTGFAIAYIHPPFLIRKTDRKV